MQESSKIKELKAWLQKWVRIFRKLCDKCEQTFKVKQLIWRVQKHFWNIENQIHFYKVNGDDAKCDFYARPIKQISDNK